MITPGRTAAAISLSLLLILSALVGARPAAAQEGVSPDGADGGLLDWPSSALEAIQSVMTPQDTKTLNPSGDAFVSSAQSGSNFGGDARLFVGWRAPYEATRTAIKFNMSDLDKREAVTSAKLRLYVREAGPVNDPSRDIVVRRITSDWSEGGVNWGNFPGSDDKRWSTKSLGTSGGWQDWTGLKDLVRGWRLPSWQKNHYRNYGVYIQGYEADGSYRAFDSREGSNKPALQIEHVRDTWAPISQLAALPQYYHAGSPGVTLPDDAKFALTWTGEDPEPWTGIDFFRVYAQRNDGPWTLVFDEVKGYSKDFDAKNGGIYRFNVYAVDQAGNLEPNKQPEAMTHVDLSAPTASVKPLPEYVTGPFALQWEGADQPTGADMVPSGLVAYNVYFRVNGGAWQATALGTTDVGKQFNDPLIDNAVYEFAAGAYDHAGNLFAPTEPQARTHLDRQAPTVVFEPVSGVTGQVVNIQWEGEDFGGSGAVSYDIQYRINREPWQNWAIGTTETSKVFTGQYSNTYSFRGRARDAAGNQGEYPADTQLVVGVIDPAIWVSKLFMPWVHKGQ